jgi:hypothetical protein
MLLAINRGVEQRVDPVMAPRHPEQVIAGFLDVPASLLPSSPQHF